MRFQSEVARLKEVNLRFVIVSEVRLGSGRNEEWVVFAPDSQHRRLMRADNSRKRGYSATLLW